MPRRKPARRGGHNPRLPLKARLVLAALSLVLAVMGSSGVYYYRQPVEPGAAPRREEIGRPAGTRNDEWPVFIARVLRVVDGDTLLVETEGRKERVRLLHVDTAESVHPDQRRNTAEGRAASAHTKRTLEGRQVMLECDPDNLHDRYGRRLAYVFIEGENFNLDLIKRGYSPYYTGDGKSRKYDDDFRRAEKEAQRLKLGSQ